MTAKRMDPVVSQHARDLLVEFRKQQLLERPKKSRSKLLSKLIKVRGTLQRLDEAIKDLPDCSWMPGVWEMQFTLEGRNTIQDGRLVVPPGMTESLWIKVLQGDKDPLKTELGNLKDSLGGALTSVKCVIGRKGRPGIAPSQDRYSFFFKCLEALMKETRELPPARVLANLAKEITGVVLTECSNIHGEQNGNWFRDAQDFLSELRKEAKASGYGDSTQKSP